MMKFKHNIKAVVMLILALLNTRQLIAQIRVDFKPRTSANAPAPYTSVTNYNLQGDFTMIGNTNMTLVNYTKDITSRNSHNGNSMRFVDVDNDSFTLNSSSAELVIPNQSCSEIIYAGLYWTGRAHDSNSSPTTFNIQKSISHNGVSNNISVTVSRIGSSNYYPQYTLSNGASSVQLEFTNNTGNSRVQYRIGTSGSFTNIPVSYSNSSNTGVATFNNPLVLTIGGKQITIVGLQRDSRTSRSETEYQSTGYVLINKQMDKRKVQLKKGTLPYQEIVATEIYFPSGSSDNLFSGYADVTDYVRINGVGNYFVADIATQEGTGGSIGYSAGWGMVVIYKNSDMKWRDITVFDGFGFMNSTSGATELPVSGFRAAQNGNVNIKLGMMAGEGDGYYSGDYFDIKKASDNSWQSLSHSGVDTGNSTGNFFNSSINVGGTSRNPNLRNNTGVDIAMFELNNLNNTIIPNNAISSTFRFGTNQDVYSIFNIVFAVDAYVPEVIGENTTANTNTVNGTPVVPGQGLEFALKMYNKGDEAVKDLKVEIPIPFNAHYDSASVVIGSNSTIKISNNTTVTWNPPVGAPSNASPLNTLGGTLVWDIGNLPKDDSKSILQGTLKYKLKITENCAFLATASACALKVNINGKIKGTGAISNSVVSSDLVREYGIGACAGPIYDDFESTISVDAAFLQACNLPVENKNLQFKAFCYLDQNKFPSELVENLYPLYTKFFDQIPSSYDSNVGVLSDGFPVALDGTKNKYYAMLPGMDPGCYIALETSLEAITSSPVVEDVIFCHGESVVLDVTLSPTGLASGYTLHYFATQNATIPLASIPTPTDVGVYTYWAAEGKEISGALCMGSKVSFTVTINPLPFVAQDVVNVSTCENNDYSVSVTTTAVSDFNWEYASVTSPTVWNALDNTTFSSVISINNGTLNITHAAKAIDGIKVRLIGKNNTDCENSSNEIFIEIKDCQAITNPMLPNKAKN